MLDRIEQSLEAQLLGEYLLENGQIRREDIDKALSLQKGYSGRIGEILVNQGACSEEDVLSALSRQLNLPRIKDWEENSGGTNLDAYLFDGHGLPGSWWLSQKAFPLGVSNGSLWVAMQDVLDVFVAEVLERQTSLKVQPVIAGGHELRQLLALIGEADLTDSVDTMDADDSALRDLASVAPVVQFVNDTIHRAVEAHASDIHFETYRGVFRVRTRVDGVLHEVDKPGIGMQAAVISRLKLMAGLDISEKRLPQDGRIRTRISGMDLDIRVATSPGVAGESVVLRLLTRGEDVASIKGLDLHADHEQLVLQLLSSANGIILVTGPTGSGKTTSLYAFLRHLATEENKIITVEDPVEYQTSGITQIQVNSEIGLNFASTLRSVLRQDPDIVLIGEIRDGETAEIAVQAALTGHLVLSTLHTNDAPSSFVRLMDIGIEEYLLSASVVGVMAQRLVRKVCPHCAVADAQGRLLAESLGWPEIRARWPDLAGSEQFVRGIGCERCLDSGFRGRRPLIEIFGVDETIRHALAIHPESISQVIRQLRIRNLREEGLLRAAQGQTTVQEVLRVTN